MVGLPAQKRSTGRQRTAKTPEAPTQVGNVASVLGLLESLRREQPLDARDEALGQLALTLAGSLDSGAGMATAAVSKELRATLADLLKDRHDGDDDSDWTAGLSAPVRHPKEL